MKMLRAITATAVSLFIRAWGQSQENVSATIEIDAAKKASFRIPRTIYGSFLEPIGNSIYGGLWAELLTNPSFEDKLWSARTIARMIQEEPALAEASQLGLPLPWEPLNPKQGNRYEPRERDAANSWRSLLILGLPDEQTGVRQKVYLPVHRESDYEGSIYARHLSGATALEISIRRRHRSDDIIARAVVEAAGAKWTKYKFKLTIPPGKVAPLEPVDFVIALSGDSRFLIDLVSLMPADNIDGLDLDMVAMTRQMKTPLVRYGGNFTSAYHWRDGIGPRDKRVSMLNVAWGMPEYNTFGTDEFLAFCKLIGAEPQIALNLGTGTADEAADWVRYVNEHWKERSGGLTWELGNELWGNWNTGYPTLAQLPGRTSEFSRAVRRVDPRAKLIATGQDPDNYESWNAGQLKTDPGTFDYLSTHFVVTTTETIEHQPSPEFLAQASFALPIELGRKLEAMQQQINSVPAFSGKAHIAFTEWLFIHGDGFTRAAPRYDNLGGAITAAAFFNTLMRHADIVPISDMTGIIEFGGIWKKRERVYGTPQYHLFTMYANADASTPVAVQAESGTYDVHNGVRRLPEIERVPYLDVLAATNDSGDKLTLFLVNRHLSADITAKLTLRNFKPQNVVDVKTLTSGSIYDINSELEPEAVTPRPTTIEVKGPEFIYRFPKASVTLVEMKRS
jgi:alpha-N-arabinofuranosidase